MPSTRQSHQGFHTRVSSAADPTVRPAHPQGPSGLKRHSLPETAPLGGVQFDAVLGNINRLFEERIEYFGLVDLNKGSIMTSICKVIIKVCS